MKAGKKLVFWAMISGWLIFLAASVAGIAQQLRQDNLDRALIRAVKKLDAPAVTRLLNAGANANARDTTEPPLTISFLLKVLLTRLQHKHNVFAVDAGDSALYLLLADGADLKHPSAYDAIAVTLIQHGADIHFNVRAGFQKTPLHEAARGLHQTTRLLLKRGVNVNARDGWGFTPLMFADEETTRLLLQHGADVNAKDYAGDNSLWTAATFGKLRVMEILLAHGANVNATDKRGHSVLFFIVTNPALQHPPVPNRAKILRLLNHYGAHFNKKDKEDLPLYNSPY